MAYFDYSQSGNWDYNTFEQIVARNDETSKIRSQIRHFTYRDIMDGRVTLREIQIYFGFDPKPLASAAVIENLENMIEERDEIEELLKSEQVGDFTHPEDWPLESSRVQEAFELLDELSERISNVLEVFNFSERMVV